MQHTLKRLVQLDEVFDDKVGVILADPKFSRSLVALKGLIAAILFGR